MQKDSRLFEDMAKLASSAAGTFVDMKREMEQMVAAQIEKFASRMQLVSREEFEAVKAMAAKAREENDALAKRLDALEKGAKAPAKKPATKKPTKKSTQ